MTMDNFIESFVAAYARSYFDGEQIAGFKVDNVDVYEEEDGLYYIDLYGTNTVDFGEMLREDYVYTNVRQALQDAVDNSDSVDDLLVKQAIDKAWEEVKDGTDNDDVYESIIEALQEQIEYRANDFKTSILNTTINGSVGGQDVEELDLKEFDLNYYVHEFSSTNIVGLEKATIVEYVNSI